MSQAPSNVAASSHIENNPKFKELVRKRDRFAWTLSIIVLVIYYAFILLVAFAGDFLSGPLYTGSLIPVGMPIGVGVIVVSFILAAVYVTRANGEFDALTSQIMKEAGK